MSSLTQLQEVPSKNSILLVGPPGSGKSTFCQQAVLKSLTIDKPVIFVTTEYGSFEVETLINEEALLFAKYLRGKLDSWIPRVPSSTS